MLEIDIIMFSEMKAKFKYVYLRTLRLLLKSKLNGRNRLLAINSWAVAVIRYSAEFIGWTKNETRELFRQTRTTRKEGGRGLTSVEVCIASELRSLRHYLVHSEETY